MFRAWDGGVFFSSSGLARFFSSSGLAPWGLGGVFSSGLARRGLASFFFSASGLARLSQARRREKKRAKPRRAEPDEEKNRAKPDTEKKKNGPVWIYGNLTGLRTQT